MLSDCSQAVPYSQQHIHDLFWLHIIRFKRKKNQTWRRHIAIHCSAQHTQICFGIHTQQWRPVLSDCSQAVPKSQLHTPEIFWMNIIRCIRKNTTQFGAGTLKTSAMHNTHNTVLVYIYVQQWRPVLSVCSQAVPHSLLHTNELVSFNTIRCRRQQNQICRRRIENHCYAQHTQVCFGIHTQHWRPVISVCSQEVP